MYYWVAALSQYGVMTWKDFLHYWRFVGGGGGGGGGLPVDSAHKGPLMQSLMFFLTVAQISCWTGSWITGDLRCTFPLQWCQNERDSVWNYRRLDCLLNRLFRRISKKTSKLRVTGLCEGNPPVTGGFPSQRASNAENVSIWWRHHAPWSNITILTRTCNERLNTSMLSGLRSR